MKSDNSLKYYAGKNIAITGAAGTVGGGLIDKLLTSNPSKLVALDNNEAGLFELGQKYVDGITIKLGDIRDLETLNNVFANIDVVFHAAALKQVPLCEQNPLEAIKTNIYGVNNVIQAANLNNVDIVINTSSDKAVNPFNVMGTSKLMGEQLISAANLSDSPTRFVSTRFGNVLGSSGSVIPVFKQQIFSGGPLTITSQAMTRFIMTLEEAVDLVLEVGVIANGGEIFVTKMHNINIMDLVEVMIEELAPNNHIELTEIGLRPGEKMFEELMTSEELRRAYEIKNHYVILPGLTDLYVKHSLNEDRKDVVDKPYNSSVQTRLQKSDLKHYLQISGVFGS